jgi:hypothetical protein
MAFLAYSDDQESSGPVEDNKARVIVKRSHSLKSCESLWTRRILDVKLGGRTAGEA